MERIRTSRFSYFNWVLFGLILFIEIIGILTLYSAAGGDTGSNGVPLYVKQCIWFLLGLILLFFLLVIDYRYLEHYGYVIFILSLLSLGYVLLFGRSISGAKRWIELGGFQFQPSEFVKLTFILALAKYFHNDTIKEPYSLFRLRIPLLFFSVAFLLVLLQPDLGSAMILFLVFVSMILFVGMKKRQLFFLIVLGLLSLPAGWSLLRDYQRERILTFLDPSRDPLGSGYHIIQSKIAIGSGKLLGKGFLHGTQTQLHFLPEQHTDFIFSVLAEEWGFLGSLILLTSYLLLLLWGLHVARKAKEPFGMMLALGITFLLFWHISINIGMGAGLLPVVGVPLPLLSYGGSFVLITLIGIALLINIHIRRFMF
jgi:rod shape determining protein RodA